MSRPPTRRWIAIASPTTSRTSIARTMAARPGRTWSPAFPRAPIVNSVKEDPQAKGLLYAATELRVYVSFNDGAQWQPLQNNMPVTSVRDIVVHGDDLAIATHGRGFWVMDQMTALRQIAAQGAQIVSANAYLFKPGETFAIRQGGMNGTPLPHEEPQMENPPAGVVAYYWLKTRRRAAAEAGTAGRRRRGARLRRQRYAGAPGRYRNDQRAGHLAAARAAAVGRRRHASLRPRRRGGTRRRRRVRTRRGRSARAGCLHARGTPAADTQAAAGRGGRGGRGGGGGGGGRGGAPTLQPGPYTVRLTVDGQTYTQPVP